MTVITLSRQLGSHGEEIATKIARALDLRLIDAETINRAAEKAGVPHVALAELEPDRERGLTNRVIASLRAMPPLSPISDTSAFRTDFPGVTIPFTGLFSTTVPPISAWFEGYVRMVGLVVRGLAREGNVLIVGRGGQILLRNEPDVLHIQIVAPTSHRIAVLMERDKLTKREAQSRLRASDRARLDYMRRYHNVNWLDPTLYHITINTDQVTVPVATDLIIDLARTMANAPDGVQDE
ncbi:MAG: cytidylate kinase-like family protein [Anaerolineae bacterium]|nr:cytidylate kinase-like family protein [Anaerolineae bacterium]